MKIFKAKIFEDMVYKMAFIQKIQKFLQQMLAKIMST